MTIKELREYLNKLESSWTAQDTTYLGEYEDQQIMVMHHKNGQYIGVGPGQPVAAYEFGIVFVEA